MAIINKYHQLKKFFNKHGQLPDMSSIKPELLPEMIDATPANSALEKALKDRLEASY
ncbi:MAG TPA: hypothetical protein VJH70_02435 [Candidatus Paceibacterota bacterium]